VRASLDIFAEAGGMNIPLIISETLVVTDGYVTVKFVDQDGGDTPKIDGIEISDGFVPPTISPAPTPLSTDAPTVYTDPGIWIETDADAPIDKRHEACFVMVGRKAYLVGGRGKFPVKDLDIYDPVTRSWSKGTPPPEQLHHMQCVAAQGKLWIVSAWKDWYPEENNAEFVYVYDPEIDTWETKTAMPLSRRRGGAAVVVSDDETKIYVSHGNNGGHEQSGQDFATSLGYLDEYDIASDSWKNISSSAPNPRDHTGGAMINGRLCVAGGRNGGEPDWPEVAPTDCYDFSTGMWTVHEDIPQVRAGASYGTTCDGNLIIAGGEASGKAWSNVDVFDGSTWTTLSSMNIGRHGSGLAVDCVCNAIYIASGSAGFGGGPEITSVETYFPDGADISCQA
jgi:N-acetylneuraminic acid mutarotase